MSPRKQLRPIKSMDSYNSQEGRSVEELKTLIKKVLQNNYQAFEEVRLHNLLSCEGHPDKKFRFPPLDRPTSFQNLLPFLAYFQFNTLFAHLRVTLTFKSGTHLSTS